MADSKISDLAASTTPLAGTELAVIVQGGVTKQVAVSDISSSDNFATADLTLTGNRIHDTNSNNLILSTDGATLNEANIGLTTSVAALSFSNTYVDIRSTGLTLFENAMERVSVKPTETVINEAGGSYDFRVEGDTDANLLFVDASTNRIGVGTNTPSRTLDVTTAGATWVNIETTGASPNGLRYNNPTQEWLTYLTETDDSLIIRNSTAGTNVIVLDAASQNNSFKIGASEVVFNESGTNLDFRVEGDTEVNLLFTDASTDRVGVGTNTPSVELDVVGDAKVSGVVQVGEYTVATLPTASTYQAGTIMVSDETGGYTMAFSDGTNWRRTQDRAIVS